MQVDGRGGSRHIIPRWRPVSRSVQLGEAGVAETNVESVPPIAVFGRSLTRALKEFRQYRSPPYAAEAIAVAIVEGAPERAKEAAEFLYHHGKDLVIGQTMIDHCLGLKSDKHTPSSFTRENIRAFRISGPYIRRDGIAWLDLALAYSSCGLYPKAERALTVARGLVGATNRLVLRAEARFYQHMGDPDRALATLRRDPDHLLADPWLLAPEIGLSQLTGKHSRLLRQARAAAEQEDRNPFHTSELAAAVATCELAAGKHRLARKLFRRAVINPAELGLAQTVWAAQEVDQLIHVPDPTALRKSAEACTHDAIGRLQWRRAKKACNVWLREEPFATTPAAILSSLLATHLDDHKGAIQAAAVGLTANPKHPSLLNNRAFASANIGKLDEAEADIGMIKNRTSDQNETNHICVTATQGLIAFRRRQLEDGERHYRQAMSMARKARHFDLEAKAGIYLLREAYLANIRHLMEDPTINSAVFSKDLHPATVCLREKILGAISTDFPPGSRADRIERSPGYVFDD